MQNNYPLGSFVVERLRFSYETHTSGEGKNLVVIEEDGDISEDFWFKDANGDDKISGIDLIKAQV